MTLQILQGDCRETLRSLPDGSVNCCVTSPPYFGLRDYGVDGQIGLEPTPEEYVAQMVSVFREVRRVLRDDGTLWLNLGDSYASGGRATYRSGASENKGQDAQNGLRRPVDAPGTKPKDLLGIPWRVAFALQADGWWLRQDIIWSKPNPMPESVTDRCTKAHEYIFLLSKSAKYWYDNEAIKEPAAYDGRKDEQFKGAIKSYDGVMPNGQPQSFAQNGHARWRTDADGNRVRSKRSVWTVATNPYAEAHFATFPPKLIEPCILAGCPEGGTVLDPFGGSGTTAMVALKHKRNAILCELNSAYIEMIHKRCEGLQPALIA